MGQVLLEDIVISTDVNTVGLRKIWLFPAGECIYDGRLHSGGLRSCDDVFLRLHCGCSQCVGIARVQERNLKCYVHYSHIS